MINSLNADGICNGLAESDLVKDVDKVEWKTGPLITGRSVAQPAINQLRELTLRLGRLADQTMTPAD
jgi:hypothetical protein